MSDKRYEDDKLFRFHWRGNSGPSEGYGRDAPDAFTRLGYSSGALGALDYYEQVEKTVAVEIGTAGSMASEAASRSEGKR